MEAIESKDIELFDEEPQTSLTQQRKLILIGAAIVVALFSAFVLGNHFTKPEAYPTTIESLDSKRTTVLALSAAATAASIGISAIPDDVGTPISNSLADLASDFTMILAAVLLQKYLLTTMGMASFQILIPIGCLLFILSVLANDTPARREAFYSAATKMVALALVLFACVPAANFISNNIENTYEASINGTIEQAQQTTENVEQSALDSQAAEAKQGEQEDGDVFSSFFSVLEGAKDAVAGKAGEIMNTASETANGLFEAFSVMIVTTLFIPILTLAFMLWAAGLILGINVNIPLRRMKPRFVKGIQKQTLAAKSNDNQ